MKRIFTLAVMLLVGGVVLQGQEFKMDPGMEAALRENLSRAANNHYPYEHGDLRETPAPKGYKPFYISHYGRHGSRSSWGGDSYRYVISALGKADSLGILNPAGREALEEAREVLAAWDGMDGRLSQRGVREHAQIAWRLAKRYPKLFKGSPCIRSIASTVQRSIISMVSFTNTLSAVNPKIKWTFDTGEQFMKYIGDTGTRSPKAKELMQPLRDHFFDAPIDSCYVLGTLFTDPEAARGIISNLGHFNYALFNTAEIAECWDIEEHILPSMQFEMVYKFCSMGGHDLFTKNGNCIEIGDGRFAAGSLLANDIIAKADEAIAGGQYVADLRFGHDYPIHYLVSYMGLEGPGSKLHFDEVDSGWWGWKELCMASNLEMIFYRNKAGHVIVKCLYQEEEKLLRGLESFSGPYYDWNTLKANFAGYSR